MKYFVFASILVVGLGGCSEFTGNPNTTTTTTSSATMSYDAKNMTGNTMSSAPEAAPENANADVHAIPYPAIHSNGQGAGAEY